MDGEADVTTFIQYKAEGVTEVFTTRHHSPFEICCGHCFYVGDTQTFESDRSCSILGCLCCYEIIPILCMQRCCPHQLHRTDHYCSNCGSHIAQAPYGRNAKSRQWFDPWTVEAYEPNTEGDWKEVRAQKLAAKGQ